MTKLGIASYVVPITVTCIGYALFQTSNNAAVMTGVGAGERGVVSGLLNLSRNLGLITGASLMGAVFAVASAGEQQGIGQDILSFRGRNPRDAGHLPDGNGTGNGRAVPCTALGPRRWPREAQNFVVEVVIC